MWPQWGHSATRFLLTARPDLGLQWMGLGKEGSPHPSAAEGPARNRARKQGAAIRDSPPSESPRWEPSPHRPLWGWGQPGFLRGPPEGAGLGSQVAPCLPQLPTGPPCPHA